MGSGERFDSISRIFGSNMSRRKALKLAFGGAAAGVASTAGMVGLTQGVAGAQCVPGCGPGQQCCLTNVAPFSPFCAPAGNQCCGNAACFPPQQCCTTAVPNFCAPPAPVFCCGRFACTPAAQCCLTGTEPHCEPLGWTCCGNTACPPGSICQGYPTPGTCVPAQSLSGQAGAAGPAGTGTAGAAGPNAASLANGLTQQGAGTNAAGIAQQASDLARSLLNGRR